MAGQLIARKFVVEGMVQGVGFRFFAHRAASRLGVAGYVKNLWDGNVEVYAIATSEQLQAMRAELERGPRAASVTRVVEEEVEVLPRYKDSFSIEHDF